MGSTKNENPPRFTLPVIIQLGSTTKELLALVASGSIQNLLDPGVASQLHLALEPQPSTTRLVSALDGGILMTIRHKTTPITLIVSGNHCEKTEFLLFPISSIPIILGFPWLALHNLHILWSDSLVRLRVGVSSASQIA